MKSRILFSFFTILVPVQAISANGSSPVIQMARAAAVVATTNALAEARAAAGLAPRIRPYTYFEHRVPMCTPTDARNPEWPENVELYRGKSTVAFEADIWSRKRIRFYGNSSLAEIIKQADTLGADNIQWYVVEGELQWHWDQDEFYNENSDGQNDESDELDDLD